MYAARLFMGGRETGDGQIFGACVALRSGSAATVTIGELIEADATGADAVSECAALVAEATGRDSGTEKDSICHQNPMPTPPSSMQPQHQPPGQSVLNPDAWRRKQMERAQLDSERYSAAIAGRCR